MPFAYWVIDHLRPSVFVELGTHTGNSYFAFCQSILENNTGTKAFAVDSWAGDAHAGFYDEEVFDSVRARNQAFASFSTLLRTTFDLASEAFENNSVDLLHIDGLHTYEAVKNDFEKWLPKMTSNGMVILHDTNVHREDFGVHKFWSEISQNYRSMEFFHSHGLGVIQLSDLEESVIPSDTAAQQNLRDVFANLGNQAMIRFERDTLLQEVARLSEERDSVALQRDALLSSHSWNVTQPLRVIGSLLFPKQNPK
jgi:hypothetical protein